MTAQHVVFFVCVFFAFCFCLPLRNSHQDKPTHNNIVFILTHPPIVVYAQDTRRLAALGSISADSLFPNTGRPIQLDLIPTANNTPTAPLCALSPSPCFNKEFYLDSKPPSSPVDHPIFLFPQLRKEKEKKKPRRSLFGQRESLVCIWCRKSIKVERFCYLFLLCRFFIM